MKRTLAVVCAVGLFAATWCASPLQAAGRGEPDPAAAYRVELADRRVDLQFFHELDLDVDGVFDGWARVYLTADEVAKLRANGFRLQALPVEPIEAPAEGPVLREPGMLTIPAAYHTYETLTSELQAIAAARPDLVRLSSLGQSVQGRQLWMMKITRYPDLEEDEPEVAYVAAMHGDEVVGKELLVGLIHHLLDGYGTDPRATALVDNTEIWIMPSMNPDGTALNQRYNANNIDLNRNFPDWFADPNNTPGGRAPETAALMQWVAGRSIMLSANFHGGTLVANYPWDNNPSGSSVFSPTPSPDHPALLSLATTYAQNNPPMNASPSFPGGVTNGADWYAISGGMQDWSYAWYGKFDMTLEISNIKWPSASTLPTFWNDNIESMLAYLERALQGVRGLVTDAATGAPVAASILLDSDPFAVYTDPQVGDYHRLVLPGSYSLQVSAPGYHPQTLPVTVTSGAAVRYDVALAPLPADLQPIAARIEDGPGGNGWLDPGETADVAVTLRNLGALATTVSGRLVPTGWYTQAIEDEATYPDLANQQSAESQSPYYTIEVAPDVPSGYKLGFVVEWQAAQGTGVSEPFYLDSGGPSCASAAASDLPRAVLDYQTATSTLNYTSGLTVDDLHVAVHIQHTYIGDLKVTLISPAGTPVVLHNRTGGGTDNIIGTYGVNLNPAQPLSILDGEPATGTWTLEVRDMAGGDTGSLVAWSVEVCGWPVETSTPEMRLRDLAKVPGGTLLRWWPYPGIQSYRVYRSPDASSAGAFIDVTSEDNDATDTSFTDTTNAPLTFFLVTGIGPQGEGPLGHF